MANLQLPQGVLRTASVENNEDGKPRVALELRPYAGSLVWMEAESGQHLNAFGATEDEAIAALKQLYGAFVWKLRIE